MFRFIDINVLFISTDLIIIFDCVINRLGTGIKSVASVLLQIYSRYNTCGLLNPIVSKIQQEIPHYITIVSYKKNLKNSIFIRCCKRRNNNIKK